MNIYSLTGKATELVATDIISARFLLILMCFNNSLTDLGFEVRHFDDLKAEDVLQKIYEGRRLYYVLTICSRISRYLFFHSLRSSSLK